MVTIIYVVVALVAFFLGLYFIRARLAARHSPAPPPHIPHAPHRSHHHRPKGWALVKEAWNKFVNFFWDWIATFASWGVAFYFLWGKDHAWGYASTAMLTAAVGLVVFGAEWVWNKFTHSSLRQWVWGNMLFPLIVAIAWWFAATYVVDHVFLNPNYMLWNPQFLADAPYMPSRGWIGGIAVGFALWNVKYDWVETTGKWTVVFTIVGFCLNAAVIHHPFWPLWAWFEATWLLPLVVAIVVVVGGFTGIRAAWHKWGPK